MLDRASGIWSVARVSDGHVVCITAAPYPDVAGSTTRTEECYLWKPASGSGGATGLACLGEFLGGEYRFGTGCVRFREDDGAEGLYRDGTLVWRRAEPVPGP